MRFVFRLPKSAEKSCTVLLFCYGPHFGNLINKALIISELFDNYYTIILYLQQSYNSIFKRHKSAWHVTFHKFHMILNIFGKIIGKLQEMTL